MEVRGRTAVVGIGTLLDSPMDVAVIATGAFTGFLVGLIGVGGGALTTPILLLVFGVAPLAAVGTDLWYAAITKTVASRQLMRANLIDWMVVKRLWMGSLTASALCVMVLYWFPIDNSRAKDLVWLIGPPIVLTAISLLFHEQLHAIGRRFRLSSTERFKMLQAPATIIAGAIVGTVVTFTSVGAGALTAVALAYLYPLRLTPARLVATDIVHAVPLAIFAGLGHVFVGHVDFALLGNLLLGSIPAVLLGVHLSQKLSFRLLRLILAIVLFSVGVKLWFGGHG